MAKRFLTFISCIIFVILATSCGEKSSWLPISTDNDMNFSYQSAINLQSAGNMVYFNLDGYIYCADKEKGISAPLCLRPECLHIDGSCNAYVSNCESLSIYDGRLFWVDDDKERTTDQYVVKDICCMEADGTDRRVFARLESNVAKEFYSHIGELQFGFFHRDNYITGRKVSEVINGDVKDRAMVMVYSFDQKTAKIIYESEDYLRMHAQVKENILYIYAFNSKNAMAEIIKYDLENDASETLYSGALKLANPIMWIDDDRIIFASRNDGLSIDSFSLETKSFEHLYSFNDGEELRFNLYGFSDSDVIGCYNLPSGFSLKIKDISGNVVLEKEIIIPDIEDGDPLLSFPCGSDDKFIYVWSSVWSSENPRQLLLGVVKKDGKAVTLWEDK